MATYADLKAQLATLDSETEAALAEEKREVINELRALIELYELTERELFPDRGRPRKSGISTTGSSPGREATTTNEQ